MTMFHALAAGPVALISLTQKCGAVLRYGWSPYPTSERALGLNDMVATGFLQLPLQKIT